MNGSKSKKRSAASSPSPSQPDEPVFFTDRSLGRQKLPDALRASGLLVETHADHFPEFDREPEPDDSRWLREVGRRGWVILTKDDQIHRNQIEIVALLSSGAPSFVLTGANQTADEMAAAYLRAMPAMLKLLKKLARPFVATVTPRGRVRLLYRLSDLIKRIE